MGWYYGGASEGCVVYWSGLDTALASWKDAVALRDQFPRAPAWGQAGLEGEVDVNNTTIGAEDTVESGGKAQRTKRVRRPNSKLSRPTWAK